MATKKTKNEVQKSDKKKQMFVKGTEKAKHDKVGTNISQGKQEGVKPAKKKEPKQGKSISFATTISILTLILSISAIVGVAVCWNRLNNQNVIGNTQFATIQKQEKQNGMSVVSAYNVLDTLQGTVIQNEKRLSVVQDDFHKLLTEQKATGGYLGLLEVEHTLKLAQLNLTFMNDVSGTISLLKFTRQRLSEVGDPALWKLQRVIADDILALESFPKLDLADLMIRIDSLNAKIAKLPLILKSEHIKTKNEQDGSDEQQSSLSKAFNKSLSFLGKLIVIRRNDQKVEPLIAPEQEINLVRNIQLTLSKAGWAALHHDTKLYQWSLGKAITWIKKFYSPNAASTKGVVDELMQLQKIQVKPKPPNLIASINLAKKLIITWDKKKDVAKPLVKKPGKQKHHGTGVKK